MLSYLLLLVLNIFITLGGSSEITPIADTDSYERLPLIARPKHYDLNIKIDVDELKFEGDVTIIIQVLYDTKLIAINYKDISVVWTGVVLSEIGSEIQYKYETFEDKPDYEFAYIRFNNVVKEGLYSMALSFSGNIRNDLKGLYKSTFNTNRVIATTHFEPSYARMVFPCFDEPYLKATFNITIIHADKFHAISNMPKAAIVGPVAEEEGYTVTTFEETPLMSTYLVAFIVSEYERYGDDTDFYVGYAPPGEAEHTKDSIEFAPKAMKELEDFLGAQYQLTLTQLASINDFNFGAMENWGLVTFRSEYLLYPNSYISPRIHQHSRLLVSHEFAHMWFGNEVTPEWWTYVWLSEGFAQFFQYYITDRLEPNWKIWEQFNVNNLQSALSQDDNENIRIMSEEIKDASQTQFDYVVYAKSSSIIRMFYEIVGKDAFKAALNKYITKNSYGAVKPENLFESFQAVIDDENITLPTSFAQLFESWSNELGYPVLTAEVKNSTHRIFVSQKRFFVDPELMANSAKGNYYIPITVVTDNSDNNYNVQWLAPTEESITIDYDKNSKFVVLNQLQAGYYRVNYDDDYWLFLAEYLSDEANTILINEENRAQLIDDAANLAKAGLVNYEIVLKLLHNLQHDIGFLPWMAANNAISFLSRMLLGSEHYGRFENFLRIIPNKNYENYKINVNYDNHVERLHRVNSVGWACQYGHEECVKDVLAIVNDYVTNDEVSLADEIRPIIFCTLSRYTDINDNLAQQLIMKLIGSLSSLNEENFGQINEIITGLGCTRNVTNIDALLDLTTQLNVFGLQVSAEIRARIAVALVSGSYEGVQLMIRYLTERYITLLRMYGTDGMKSVLNTVASRIVTNDVSNSFDSFISTYKSPLQEIETIYETVTKAQATISTNLKWRAAYGESIEKWLQDNIDDLPKTDGSTIIILSRAILFIAIAAMLHQFI